MHATEQRISYESHRRRDELSERGELCDWRFRSLLTAAEWRSLPEDVRRRFSRRIKSGETAVFIGRLTDQRHSVWGRLLAAALRPIGAPLPWVADIGTASIVSVTEDGASGGQIWTRLYANRRGFPQIIQSSKRFGGPTGLEEHIGCGISIALALSTDRGALVFRDHGYRLRIAGLDLALPRWLSPGRLTVRHAETRKGWFRFSMELVHPWFGELVYQEGIYREEEAE